MGYGFLDSRQWVPKQYLPHGRPHVGLGADVHGACAQLTRGIEKTANALVAELQKLSVEVRDEDLANVATVSAGGNAVVRALPFPASLRCILHVPFFEAGKGQHGRRFTVPQNLLSQCERCIASGGQSSTVCMH